MFKGSARSDVVHEDDALGAAVVGGSECSETFLAGSVPDGEFVAGSIDFDDFDLLRASQAMRGDGTLA